jgi:inositol-hexakisphosphate kinase
MSSSPIEPENAASTGSVRPAQGHKNSRDVVKQLPKTTQWNPPPRTKSASLLTQALATTYEVDESSSSETATGPQLPIDHPETQSNTIPTGTLLPDSQPHNGLKTGEGLADDMAMVASMSVGNLRTSITLGSRTTTTSPTFDKHDFTTMPGHHRDFTGTAKVRGTSLERTAKEKRVQDLSGGFYSNNPGDTGMIGERPPPRSPTSPESISSNPPTDGMRAQYRSWRDVRPGIAAERTWSIGGQGRDTGHGGQVEKSIGEALAGVEPNSRSRKASHSLGLFKEGLPDDKSNSRDSSNASRFRDAYTHSRALSAIRNSTLQHGQESSSRRPKDVDSASRPDWRSPSNSPFEDDRPSSRQSLDGAMKPTAPTPDTSYFDIVNDNETITEDQNRQLPSNLLADIRKNHNLTPGASKGSSFSGSIAVPASEKLQKDAVEEQEDQKPTAGEEDFYDGPGLIHVKSTDEGNDSGEEQVFRALFVPHQSTHQAPDRTGHGMETDSIPDIQPCLEATSRQWLEEHKVSSHDTEENSEDESLSIHGPLPKEAPEQQKVSPPHDDQIIESNAHDLSAADMRDITLPTKESGNGHGQYVHDHQLEMTEPLFAIELKPYRHQVGGHTTMWKFSKRAVCKLLNNRENEFYERIERHHPQLLDFMPRYVRFHLPFKTPNLKLRPRQEFRRRLP